MYAVSLMRMVKSSAVVDGKHILTKLSSIISMFLKYLSLVEAYMESYKHAKMTLKDSGTLEDEIDIWRGVLFLTQAWVLLNRKFTQLHIE